MALFGLGKKKEEVKLPIDAVIQMRQQGYSNNQIIQALQREGYSTTQIFDAMSQAGIATGAPTAPAPQPQPQPQPEEEKAPEYEEHIPSPEAYESQQAYPSYPSYPAPAPESSREQIEEIAEAIIEEKWEELSKGVQKIINWKNETETKINKIMGELKALKKNFDDLHKGVLGKLSEYDKGIKEVGTDIKAMEEVFKKVIPTFTENVSELSRITKKMKKK